MGESGRTLVLGVDGGNSKTDIVIADGEGEVLAEVRGDGTLSHVTGIPTMVAGLADLVQQARTKAGLGPDDTVGVGAYFIANLDVPEAEAQAVRELQGWGLADRTEVFNDTLAPLRAGAPEAWGISVVSGAGINAVGVDPAGREERFLALGDVTGDWGGGYAVGMAGLGAAVRAGDGRGPYTALREAVATHYGLESPEVVALALSEGRLPMPSVHDLAPVVFATAEQGDRVATDIVLRLADEVGLLVTALVRRLSLENARTPVVLAGGTLQQQPGSLVLEAVRDRVVEVCPDAQLRVLDVRPVAGAVLAALDLVPHATDAEARIRGAFALHQGAAFDE